MLGQLLRKRPVWSRPASGRQEPQNPTGLRILSSHLLQNLERYGREFMEARPFRHVLITPFFEPEVAEAILSEFPVPVESEMRSEFGRKNRKYACHDVRSLGPAFRNVDDYMTSPHFAAVMQKLTGLEKLLYDPEYHGAGTHDNLSGQGMEVHVDFNLHRTTGFHRRLNAIVYLNKEWLEEWGGCLELHTDPWDFENDKFISYPPLFNHCVLFETNEISWHGFKKIGFPDGRELSRKSFTIYMYTKERPEEEIAPKHGTIYVPEGAPRHFRPGYTLTAEDVRLLTNQFNRRNAYLKAMYGRESRLLVQLENLKRRPPNAGSS